MSAHAVTSFLLYYIRSLAERTRQEKTSVKIGFDWIIYNLALADDLTPHRLPFLRSGPTEISKTKTEPEFGIDASFLSSDRRTLIIFVLKDEVLTNANWTAKDFDSDLRKAAAPDLRPPEFENVNRVKVILAYNKDEDQTGIQLYTHLTAALGNKIANEVELSFERWNLTTLTERVRSKLLTPSLLPQQFFSLFNYTCAQFGDFRHGSDEWTKQLIPNWRHFIDDLLKDNTNERCVRMLPVALIILREYGKDNLSAETGWIDLAEWAMLAAWRVFQLTESYEVKAIVAQMWNDFYITELERYYQQHANELAIEHSLETSHRSLSYLDATTAAVISYWHIGRLGILGLSFGELMGEKTDQQRQAKVLAMRTVANQMVSLLNANSATNRPLIDLHHIELFLIWRTLWQIGRVNDIYSWLTILRSSLLIRRAGTIPLPFIDGGNSLDLCFEYAATGERPPEFNDQSSMLLLCLLEFCFSLQPAQRNELLALYYREIILGQDSYGEQMHERKPIDIMGWAPPDDWMTKILTKSLADDGESQTVETFASPRGTDGSSIAQQIEAFVRQSRSAKKTVLPSDIPSAVIVLACLKHRSPLPAELWRRWIFDVE